MSLRLVLPALTVLFAAACHSTPKAPCADTQAIVAAVAKEHPEVARLTVHTTMPGGTGPIAVASTSAEKLGKPSDIEDVNAMNKGETVVIENVGELDVTVPMCQVGSKFTASTGVTFKTEKGYQKQQLVDLAKAITKVVEAKMAANKK